MRKIAVLAVLLATASLALADTSPAFSTDNYITCGAYSVTSLTAAREAVKYHEDVEKAMYKSYIGAPAPIAVSMAKLAQSALEHGFDSPDKASELAHFLTGVCYQSVQSKPH